MNNKQKNIKRWYDNGQKTKLRLFAENQLFYILLGLIFVTIAFTLKYFNIIQF